MDKNPYDFVRTDWTREPDRTPGGTWHNKFRGLAGYIECNVIVQSPVFIPNAKVSAKNEFCYRRNKKEKIDKHYFIPGSSLKGMLRSVVEAVENGCYLLFGGFYKNNNPNRQREKNLHAKLPEKFRACSDIHALCVGCRLFGMMGKNNKQVYRGNVNVSDAVLVSEIDAKIFEKFELGAMGGPGPWHTTFYLDKKDKHIAGRKFYYHHYKANNVLHRGAKAKTAIKKGTFTFKVHFQNILKTDFPVLLYSLVLEDTMWHKIGYGKPQGLGSIKIECTKIVLTSQEKRYTDAENATQEYDRDSGLANFIQEIREGFIAQHPSPFVLDDLRKIWSNDVSADTSYEYPGLKWFDDHGDVRLEDYQKGVRE